MKIKNKIINLFTKEKIRINQKLEKIQFNVIKKVIAIILCVLCYKFATYIKFKKTSVYIMDLNEKFSLKNTNPKSNNIKVALCTMGKKENLYVSEFVGYHLKIGIDHIFIYDDNDPKEERMSDAIPIEYKNKTTVIENIKKMNLNNQPDTFTHCYQNNINKFNWFVMIDMDEFVYIVNGTIKDYLSNNKFNKCDFIRLHWVSTNDNGLVHYDNRSLFERFKPPYFIDTSIKTVVKGNIPKLKYWVHSPDFSPGRNISCINTGDLFNGHYHKEGCRKINIEKSFIIHFRYKSTEEFIAKYKRGMSNWFGNRKNEVSVLNRKLDEYFEQNEITLEKLDYVERELNISLLYYRIKYYVLKFSILFY